MDLLQMVEGEIIFSPYALSIKCLKAVHKRDHGASVGGVRVKHRALMEFSYIWFMENYKSPYHTYIEPEERVYQIKKDLGLAEDWKEDALVKEAREWYAQKLIDSSATLKALASSTKALVKIADFLDNVDLNRMVVQNGVSKPMYMPKDITGAIKEISGCTKSIAELTEAVKKEELVTSAVRGGGDVGDYER